MVSFQLAAAAAALVLFIGLATFSASNLNENIATSLVQKSPSLSSIDAKAALEASKLKGDISDIAQTDVVSRGALNALAKVEAQRLKNAVRKIDRVSSLRKQTLDKVAAIENAEQKQVNAEKRKEAATSARESQMGRELQEAAQKQHYLAEKQGRVEMGIKAQEKLLATARNKLNMENAYEEAYHRHNIWENQRLTDEKLAQRDEQRRISKREKQLETEEHSVALQRRNLNTVEADLALATTRLHANTLALDKFEQKAAKEKAELKQKSSQLLRESKTLSEQQQQVSAEGRRDNARVAAMEKTVSAEKAKERQALAHDEAMHKDEIRMQKEQRAAQKALEATANLQAQTRAKENRVAADQAREKSELAARKTSLNKEVMAIQDKDSKRQSMIYGIQALQRKATLRLNALKLREQAASAEQRQLESQEATVATQQANVAEEEKEERLDLAQEKELDVKGGEERAAMLRKKGGILQEKELALENQGEMLRLDQQRIATAEANEEIRLRNEKTKLEMENDAKQNKLDEELSLLRREKKDSLRTARRDERALAKAEAKAASEATELRRARRMLDQEQGEVSEEKAEYRAKLRGLQDEQVRDKEHEEEEKIRLAEKVAKIQRRDAARRRLEKAKQERLLIREETSRLKKMTSILKKKNWPKLASEPKSISLKSPSETSSLAATGSTVTNDGVTSSDLLHKHIHVDVRSLGAPVHVGLHKGKGNDDVEVTVYAGAAPTGPLRRKLHRLRHRRRRFPGKNLNRKKRRQTNTRRRRYPRRNRRLQKQKRNGRKKVHVVAPKPEKKETPAAASNNIVVKPVFIINHGQWGHRFEHTLNLPAPAAAISAAQQPTQPASKARPVNKKETVSRKKVTKKVSKKRKRKTKTTTTTVTTKSSKSKASNPDESYDEWVARLTGKERGVNWDLPTSGNSREVTNPRLQNFNWNPTPKEADEDAETAAENSNFSKWVKNMYRRHFGSDDVPKNWIKKMADLAHDYPSDSEKEDLQNFDD